MDATEEAGISVPNLGQTCTFLDFDKIRGLDLFISEQTSNHYLYWNENETGSFKDITSGDGFQFSYYATIAAADYDGDGWTDLLITRRYFGNALYLYRNDGNRKSFTDVTSQAGIDVNACCGHVAWADYNRDGHADFYKAKSGSNFLYRNNGDGTFSEVAAECGVADDDESTAAAWGDYNSDGWPDLYVANDGMNRLYRNNGPPKKPADKWFTDVTATAGVGGPTNPYANDTQGAAWGDYDNDGDLDLYMTNISDLFPTQNFLYRNNGNGTFTDVSNAAGVADVGDGRTCGWVDYDNDGLIDIFSTNHVNPNRMFRNNGNGTFTDKASEAEIDQPADVFGAAWGDYNGDGFQDVFLAGHFGNKLKKNNGNANHWLSITLVSTSGTNTSGIGARLELQADLDGDGTVESNEKQIREVDGGSGMTEQPSLEVEFGLRSAAVVQTLTIGWPAGVTETYSNIGVDQRIKITEGSGIELIIHRVFKDGNDLLLYWTDAGRTDYTVYRSLDPSDFSAADIFSSSQPSYRDVDVVGSSVDYYYRVE
ncbi:MAG: CRTAC1 family protein [Acidobacteriota bacterium]